MHMRGIFISWGILLVGLASPCLAQDASVQEGSGSATQELGQLIERLKQNSKRLGNKISPEKDPSFGVVRQPQADPVSKPAIDESVSKIRNSLKLLRKFKQQKALEQSQVEKLPLTPGKQPGETKIRLPKQDMLMVDSPPPAIPKAADDQKMEKEIAATRIIPKPINTLEMATSIYLTGNYAAAKEAFDKVDDSQLTAEDTVWLNAMKAACLRRLKMNEDANGFYREIANDKSGSASVKKNAGFWLKYNEAKGRNEQLYDSIDQDLNILLELVDERLNKSK